MKPERQCRCAVVCACVGPAEQSACVDSECRNRAQQDLLTRVKRSWLCAGHESCCGPSACLHRKHSLQPLVESQSRHSAWLEWSCSHIASTGCQDHLLSASTSMGAVGTIVYCTARTSSASTGLRICGDIAPMRAGKLCTVLRTNQRGWTSSCTLRSCSRTAK